MYADSSKTTEVHQERRARPWRAPGTSSKAPWGRQIPANHPARSRHQTDAARTARRARAGARRSRARLPCRLACRWRGSRACLGSRRPSPPRVRPGCRKVTVTPHVRVVHHGRVQQGQSEQAHLPGRQLLDRV